MKGNIAETESDSLTGLRKKSLSSGLPKWFGIEPQNPRQERY
jgi:hypothetical protein